MQPPKLYNRGSADLVADARALAHVYTPDWSGVDDPHDAGHGLTALAVRLVELLAERINRVPEKNLLAFLDFVGVERSPGIPAEVPVTFLLSSRTENGQQVPAGTQVATTQSEAADAQVFETRNAFFATPAQLAHVLNVLPGEDRYGVLPMLPRLPSPADVAGASNALDILSPTGSGLLAVPHELYLASASLFGRDEPTTVSLDFTLANPSPDAFAIFSEEHLVWQRFNAATKGWEDITGVGYEVVRGTVASVRFTFPGTDKSTVGGEEDAWIVVRLKTAPRLLSGLPVVSALFGSIATAQAPPAGPDAALFNDTSLDVSKPAFPFGARPRYGDAFHVASAKAFGADIATATVQVTLRLYSVAEVQEMFKNIVGNTTVTTTVEWQYLSAGGQWQPIPNFRFTHTLDAKFVANSLPSITQAGVRNGTLFGTIGGADPIVEILFSFAPPLDFAVGKVGGISSRWVRAVLRSPEPYGRDGFVTFVGAPAQPKAVGPTFMPPIIEKIEVSYEYRSSSIPLDRITTMNNFEPARHAPPFFGAGRTLSPFVPLAEYAPAGSTGFLTSAPGLYLAFDQKFENAFISLLMAFVEPRDTARLLPETGGPHIVWEYLGPAGQWKSLDVRDGTADLTSSGIVAFQSPPDSVPEALFSLRTSATPLYWYRARLQGGGYTTPPKLAAVLTNTVMADNQQTVRGDWLLASGSGEGNQQTTILRRPVLAGDVWVREDEVPAESELNQLVKELQERAIEKGAESRPLVQDVIEKRAAGTPEQEVWVQWLRVANFRGSSPRSRHYTLEAPAGLVTFGDGVEGLIPTIGKDNIVVRGLCAGGGDEANRIATPLAIKELKTSLPFIDKVFNFSSAVGGADPWSIDQTFDLGPEAIKNRGRAVTVEDYEWVTLAAFGQVARVKALATKAPAGGGTLVFKPGAVSIIVVPKGSERKPQPPKGLLRRIESYLRGRSFAAISVDIFALPPAYEEVAIAASVRPRRPEDASAVQRRVLQALEAFFHPLTGGEHQEGWPFGRSVYISEVFAVVERTDGVDHVVAATFVNAPTSTSVTVGENVLVASGAHRITVV
ncbi:MAG: putative baseplate assembly protein [Acidobacteriota bacterium]